MAIFRGTGGQGDSTTDTTVTTVTQKAAEAASSATSAANSATSASNSATSAETSATNAATSETNAATSATNAATSETNSATSATSASTSATTATTKASEASTSATNAATSATAAQTAQTAAEAAQTAAETAETNAETAEANTLAIFGDAQDVQDAVDDAEKLAINPEDSQYTLSDGTTTGYSALHYAAKAEDHKTAAEVSKNAAETAETAAETAQGLAETAQTAAETAQSLAETAQAAAELAQSNAETVYDNFDDRYLGNKSGDPLVDNDNEGLTTGTLYFNTTESEMRVYTGTAWEPVQELSGDQTVNSLTSNNDVVVKGNLEVQGTTITVDSATAQTIDLGDNDKIRLGDSDDLQIYHDGTKSYISDTGTGTLDISTNGSAIRLVQGNGNRLVTAGYGTAGVKLWYGSDDTEKLATTSTGIDITGTVTADAIDADAIEVLGSGQLKFSGGFTSYATNNASPFIYRTGTSSGSEPFDAFGNLVIQARSNAAADVYVVTGITPAKRLKIEDTGDISFYDNSGSSQDFYWDASTSRLGLGTTSPVRELHVVGGNDTIRLESTGANTKIEMVNTTSSTNEFGFLGANFFVSPNGSEAMRIDSSGNLLVGTTDSTLYNSTSDTGIAQLPLGKIEIARSGGTLLTLNRLSSDGTIAEFRKDGSTIGSIGVASSDLLIDGNSDRTGLAFRQFGEITPRRNGALANGTADLGSPSYRFRNLYLSGGIYLGGTGSANLLDDYEEGGFVPVLADATSGGNESDTTLTGKYVKVGALVYIQISGTNINTTGLTAGNNAVITGLPFTVQSTAGVNATCAVWANQFTFTDTLLFSATQNSTYGNFVNVRSGLNTSNVVISDIADDVADFKLSLTYRTDS